MGAIQVIAVDTSALVAILVREPEADAFLMSLEQADSIVMSPVSLLEINMVIRGEKGYESISDLEQLLADAEIKIWPFDEAMAKVAVTAFVDYGRGSGSSAKLNFGDCASYALAKSLDIPLLFKGADFVHTDIVSAV